MVLGIRPTRAAGYGYIEAGGAYQGEGCGVRRFTEKPDAKKADEFVNAGNYYWNSGMFLWSARTLADALREHLPVVPQLCWKRSRRHSAAANLPAHFASAIPNAKT